MYFIIYPEKDSVLYERFPSKNTGVDQILELTKIAAGQPYIDGDETSYLDYAYNSRILIKFDLTELSSSIVSGKIYGNQQYYLTLKATEAIELPISYQIFAYPISQSWVNGTGFYNNDPEKTNGVSWIYRTSKLSNTIWTTSSFNSNSTGSWATNPGGGTWFTSSYSSQTFNYDNPDIRMDVTSIVQSWLSGSIPNEGLILKFPDSLEQDTSILGSIQFFSKETHTIFLPRLECYWNSQNLTGINQISEINSDDFILYCKNLKETYNENEKPKIKLGVRERYPTYTYSTSSNYLQSYRLPTSSYFQIQDYVTDDAIIPFHNYGTLIDCDSNGNYLQIDCNSLMPERYYKLIIKSEFEGGNVVRYIDDGYIFKIVRN